MKKLALSIFASLFFLTGCNPSTPQIVYKFGTIIHGWTVNYLKEEKKFTVSLTSKNIGIGGFVFKLAASPEILYDEQSEGIEFIDSENEEIVFDEEIGYYYFVIPKERIITISYSDEIAYEMTIYPFAWLAINGETFIQGLDR